MPSTARQLRQPPTIEAIGRVPYFADVDRYLALNRLGRVVPISYIIMPLFNYIVLSLAIFT